MKKTVDRPEPTSSFPIVKAPEACREATVPRVKNAYPYEQDPSLFILEGPRTTAQVHTQPALRPTVIATIIQKAR